MPVDSFDGADRFIVRVVKHLITNPDDTWANSYEFRATDPGGEAELLALGTAVVEFERLFHYDTTIFDRLLISTWEEDSVPYDPSAFISTSLSAVGELTALTSALALNQCLSVTRVATSGRFGHLFYRNCVAEGDVFAPAGKTVLNERAVFQTRIDGAIDDSDLTNFIGSSASGGLNMVMVNKSGSQTRMVAGLFVQGVSTIKTDHKWFNRTSPA